MRPILFLFLAGCPKGWPATPAPTFDDAVCLGFAFGATAADITQQVVNQKGLLPGIDLNVGGCLELTSPLTCEERAKFEAWMTWSVSVAEALANEVNNPDGSVHTPGVAIAECP